MAICGLTMGQQDWLTDKIKKKLQTLRVMIAIEEREIMFKMAKEARNESSMPIV